MATHTPSTTGSRQMFTDPLVMIEARADGTRILRSGIPLPDTYTRCVGEWLEQWAREAPERMFLAQRGKVGAWIALTYGEARRRVVAIASWLLGQNLSPERPLVILSDNSIEHALLMLAAMHIGVPLGRTWATTGAPHALFQCRHRRCWTDLRHGMDVAKVDAQLER